MSHELQRKLLGQPHTTTYHNSPKPNQKLNHKPYKEKSVLISVPQDLLETPPKFQKRQDSFEKKPRSTTRKFDIQNQRIVVDNPLSAEAPGGIRHGPPPLGTCNHSL